MKEERFNISNEQVNQYLREARVLRSKEVLRLTGQLFRAPLRLVSRFTAFKIESARATVESR
jgi:hypothetical protein